MQSQNYKRAQAMVLSDKFNMAKSQFFEEFSALANRYFVVGALRSEAYSDEDLQVVITLSVKKVKLSRSPQS